MNLPITGSIQLMIGSQLGVGVSIKKIPGSAGLKVMSSVLSKKNVKEEKLQWRRNWWSAGTEVTGKRKDG